MGHRFVIMRDDKLYEYTEYEQIPDDFDHVIEFAPDAPQGPHTDQQHEEIAQWLPFGYTVKLVGVKDDN